MAKWSVDLSRYARNKVSEIEKVRKTYAFALYSSIVKKTPVDTGRARGNWNVSAGSPDESVTDEKRKTPRKIEDLPEAKGDESIFISNNLPYIQSLEYGSSKQAPSGMVGATLANNANIFNAALKSVTENRK